MRAIRRVHLLARDEKALPPTRPPVLAASASPAGVASRSAADSASGAAKRPARASSALSGASSGSHAATSAGADAAVASGAAAARRPVVARRGRSARLTLPGAPTPPTAACSRAGATARGAPARYTDGVPCSAQREARARRQRVPCRSGSEAPRMSGAAASRAGGARRSSRAHSAAMASAAPTQRLRAVQERGGQTKFGMLALLTLRHGMRRSQGVSRWRRCTSGDAATGREARR